MKKTYPTPDGHITRRPASIVHLGRVQAGQQPQGVGRGEGAGLGQGLRGPKRLDFLASKHGGIFVVNGE